MTLMMRDNQMKEIGREEGIEIGMQKGIQKGITQGEDLFASLTKILITENRTDDLIRATYDIEFKQQLYKQYGIGL